MSLKATVKKLLVQGCRLVCPKNVIVLESTPDFSDNTFAVYEELVKRGFADRYTLVWSCSKHQKLDGAPASVRYIYPLEKSLWQKLRNFAYMSAAKCLICCNRYLLAKRQGQTTFYLSHGTALKNVRNYNAMPDSIDYCLCTAEGVRDIMAYALNTPKEKVVALGYPRNDILTAPTQPVKEMLGTSCKKVIVWYPTFRQHKQASGISCGNAMPIIHDAQAAVELNECAKQLDVLIVMKPHFAQDLSYMKDLGLSHIRFIDDAFFREHHTSSYGFVAGCDALLSDYSSIYFDFLLCDKPVGLIWEDIDQYRKNPGFAVDVDQIGKGATVIYTAEDFKRFLQEVAGDEDPHRQARNLLCDRFNCSRDGKNASRVTDFIIEKAAL